jgi:hypothetical protein
MHTITLKIQDHVLDKVVYFLNNLPKKDVQIVSDKSEYSADKESIKNDDFISKLMENPVHLDKNVRFLSREKIHER